MSMNNSYNFGSQNQQRSQNQNQNMYSGGDLVPEMGLKLNLSHLINPHPGMGGGNGNDNASYSQRLQLQQLLAQQQHQQQKVSGPSQQMPSLHQSPVQFQGQQTQQPSKKVKETVLKTPLSLLNEVCAKAKTAPVFTLEESGPVHMRVYECVVKVDTHGFVCEATASGKTKKDAKQEAAKALLVKMDNDVEQYLIPTVAKEEPITPIVEVDPEVPGNPVGSLNDLCTKLKRLPPEYEDIDEIGKPHERVYTVACKLGSHIMETGRGRSKKSAKKVAAYKVHKRVMELLTKESEGTALLQDEDDLLDKLNTLTLVSKNEAKKMNASERDWKLSDWLDDMRNRSGPKLDMLKDPKNPNYTMGMMPTDPVKLLEELAEEQKLKVEFMEVADKNLKNPKKCLIAVSAGNQPLTVLMGSADSKRVAKKNAADNFIQMLLSVLLTSS